MSEGESLFTRRARRRTSSLGLKQKPPAKQALNFADKEKKKLQLFIAELMRTGCLKGFKYFALYLRGREELVCRIFHEPMSSDILQYYTAPDSAKMKTGSSSFTFDTDKLPITDKSLIMSVNTQKSLTTSAFMEVGLPPASPSEKDIDNKDDNSTIFLIAAYARYNCPYVWVRSNHERLVTLTGDTEEKRKKQKDSPLKLNSTLEWKQKDTKLWDIISELVTLCMVPSPRNPFSVNHKFFDSLPLAERVIATGAMVEFLQKVINSFNYPFNEKVSSDLVEVMKKHFKDLQLLRKQKREEESKYRSQQQQERMMDSPEYFGSRYVYS